MNQRSAPRRFWDDILTAMYPAGSERDEYLVRRESRGLYAAGIVFILVAITSLIVFREGDVPLWGLRSVGAGALVAGALAGVIGPLIGQRDTRRGGNGEWRRELPLWQRIMDLFAVTILHAIVLTLICAAVFYTLAQAFRELEVDAFTTMMITSVTAAIGTYASYLSAVNMDAQRLSVLLAVFVLAGMMTSMITSPEADWWRLHFSELGTDSGVSGTTFNLTMIISGPVLASLALYIGADLRRWERGAAPSATRNIRLFQTTFIVVGAALVGVGLVPVNESLLVHNIFATGMAVVFGIMLLGLRWLLDGLPRAIFVFSDALVVGIVVSALLWWPAQYYELTAFELIAAGIIFLWLIVFIRNVGALAESGGEADGEPTPKIPQGV